MYAAPIEIMQAPGEAMTGWNWKPQDQLTSKDKPACSPAHAALPRQEEAEVNMAANPDDDLIIVNMRNVPKATWQEAKKLALKHGETLVELISRLIDQAARSDTAPREMLTMADFEDANLPSKTANPEIDRLALLTAVTALSAATQRKIPGAVTFAAEMIREARGLPPLPPRLTGPKRGKVAATNGHDQITEDTHK